MISVLPGKLLSLTKRNSFILTGAPLCTHLRTRNPPFWLAKTMMREHQCSGRLSIDHEANQLRMRPPPLRFVDVRRNRLRASAGFQLFLGVQGQLDHALEQLIGR